MSIEKICINSLCLVASFINLTFILSQIFLKKKSVQFLIYYKYCFHCTLLKTKNIFSFSFLILKNRLKLLCCTLLKLRVNTCSFKKVFTRPSFNMGKKQFKILITNFKKGGSKRLLISPLVSTSFKLIFAVFHKSTFSWLIMTVDSSPTPLPLPISNLMCHRAFGKWLF